MGMVSIDHLVAERLCVSLSEQDGRGHRRAKKEEDGRRHSAKRMGVGIVSHHSEKRRG